MSNLLRATAIAALATLVFFFQSPARAADVEHRCADIVSDGVRLSAHLFQPKSSDGPLPAIIMSHGWGDTAAGLESQATGLAIEWFDRHLKN